MVHETKKEKTLYDYLYHTHTSREILNSKYMHIDFYYLASNQSPIKSPSKAQK